MKKLNDPQLQTWHIILLVGILVVALVLGVMQRLNQRTQEDGGLDNTPPVLLNAQSCGAAGGTWNECGSACRGQEDEGACIAVCVAYCECADSNACPFGSECVNYINGVGVCANSF